MNMKKNNLSYFLLLIALISFGKIYSDFSNKSAENKNNIQNTTTTEINQINNIQSQTTTLVTIPTTNSKTSNIVPKNYLNKNVPFAIQAPNANWDFVHQEACEETAILIAQQYFYGNKKDLDSDQNEQNIQEIISWERSNFGYFEDTNLENNQEILMKMFNLKSEIIENPQIVDIQKALTTNSLILVPTAGRMLNNPNFTGAGPIFHMVVVIGWDDSNFIVHDVGTKKGKEYKYPFEILLGANHDLYKDAKYPLDAELIKSGSKKVLLVSK
ncbi:MAG: hypothetical protein UR93_C0001G0005 [Berkelbacteria bacterium GW2011_GWA2_35_9]|uniref:Peptidase C39-like domain-containing protein n=1 Tax=Berkelbacteria bacterium GW2011_GWA2_35_9 TaxID=1618333 RepID=A0A0G0D7C2_9BACT|nr:MAG: hypothetical protein UR93_C0001G0005 [Berkelbacteria bacterium GW2011_GWA2_35_9]